MKNVIFFAVLFALQSVQSTAQEALTPRPSPLAMTTMKYEGAYVKLTYCRPHKNGRTIFGELVPYGKLWRTGANEATELTTTKKLLINAKPVEAGTYSIFTIPDKVKWTIIINKDQGLWGDYNYNPDLDVARFDVVVQETKELYEPLTMEFDQNNDRATLTIKWEHTMVSIPIHFINESK